MKTIPYSRQSITSGDVSAVAKAMRGDIITGGPYVDRLEQRFAAEYGRKHAIACTSGAAALHLAYYGLGIGPGDEVITTPITYVATAHAAVMKGAKVVFADVDPITGLIDPSSVIGLLTARTKAIVAVDYSGMACDYGRLIEICRSRDIKFVVDAAHSLGGIDAHGRKAGSVGDCVTFSFHPVKSATAGEGGMLLTDDDSVAALARAYRINGLVRGDVSTSVGPWAYDISGPGENYRMCDMNAALLLSQLDRLPKFIEERRAIADRYIEELDCRSDIMLPDPSQTSAWHLFVVRMRDFERRKKVFMRLRAAGIFCQVHYIPVNSFTYYRGFGCDAARDTPLAVDFYNRCISLPVYVGMKDTEHYYVVKELIKALLAK